MIQKINKAIAQYGMWIFLGAATYKFVFWIINMVQSFKAGAGYGLKTLFGGMFDYVLDLVILAVLLELSRYLASKCGSNVAQNNNFNHAPVNNYNPQAAQQMPAAPTPNASMPTAQPTTVQPTANNVWYCSNCGTPNSNVTSFCSKCGKPK